MSYIPQDLVEEVLSRLPVRSILRFTCVSKQWRTINDSPYFIKIHMDRSIKMGSSVVVIHRRTDINFVSLHLDLFGVPIRAAKELDHPFGHRYDRTEELYQPSVIDSNAGRESIGLIW
ncbi:F-box CPR30-like [Olea europaea subsp. europaea]|uniref:F-box CPR30-like n=1 Tax=Olea europaea subsp. europaea TaxID=158383 RepID=A0A8S0QER0_OLEEU|nr:F-box CPR30-like [Olea europaea subsp. europaea]